MTREELDVIRSKHEAWINGEEGGVLANLRDANLLGANLQGANLQGANLRDADLRGANLQDANLQGADLRHADLRHANLQDADLQDAYLRHANLQGANLQDADLQGANLQDADLRLANLQDANLDYSDFPLWCGGTSFKADDRLVAQVLAHLCSLEVSGKARSELDKILSFARTSHRAKECGILPENGDEE